MKALQIHGWQFLYYVTSTDKITQNAIYATVPLVDLDGYYIDGNGVRHDEKITINRWLILSMADVV